VGFQVVRTKCALVHPRLTALVSEGANRRMLIALKRARECELAVRLRTTRPHLGRRASIA
jgi:hypothetical protein